MSARKPCPQFEGRLDMQRIPAHIGIIMDGNGRWAKSRGLPRSLGHKAGVERLRSVVRMSSDIGVEVLTVYAFSTENWSRPKDEVGTLMRLLIEFMHKEIDELNNNSGRVEDMPERVREAVRGALESTADNTGLILNIALNYGGRDEIVNAARMLARDAAAGLINPDDIDESAFERRLYTAGLPEPDMIIRTSGEMRLSNFMLYQAAYSEFVFADVHWPDFDDDVYADAITRFQRRRRRFGGVGEE